MLKSSGTKKLIKHIIVTAGGWKAFRLGTWSSKISSSCCFQTRISEEKEPITSKAGINYCRNSMRKWKVIGGNQFDFNEEWKAGITRRNKLLACPYFHRVLQAHGKQLQSYFKHALGFFLNIFSVFSLKDHWNQEN